MIEERGVGALSCEGESIFAFRDAPSAAESSSKMEADSSSAGGSASPF